MTPLSDVNTKLDRLTDAMATIIECRSISHVNADIIPKFNPEVSTNSINKWLRKVDELASVYQWPEKNTASYFALSRLRSLALTWYDGLKTVKYSWSEWKEQLMLAFPPERDFYEIVTTVSYTHLTLPTIYSV